MKDTVAFNHMCTLLLPIISAGIPKVLLSIINMKHSAHIKLMKGMFTHNSEESSDINVMSNGLV